ncbi:MAG TPA: SMP-30/gluconolactonase/LRE family protein [Chthonomonadaceae bacterium]|nr:SMP-30/gluconolactonase/LRE family protein [Chthonomonadaceae bacterium]
MDRDPEPDSINAEAGAINRPRTSDRSAPGHARDYRWRAAPQRYPDPDVIVLDPRFAKIKVGTAVIERLFTGMRWAEGPAWCAAGQYLALSDIPNDRRLRYFPDDHRTGKFHAPSNYSNGNTYDWQGRLLSCEHGTRRVVRYEHDGSVSVLADSYLGKPLNAPNDIVVHPDGGIWFTDPGYGSLYDYEGYKGELHHKEAVYRIDAAAGAMQLVLDDMFMPNGLCFSPDYNRLYVADSGISHYPEAPRNIRVYDVRDSVRLTNGREFCSMALPAPGGDLLGLADGIRCDTEGNIWAAAGWAGAGYDGVHIFAPDGERIGQVLLPEICANVCFGGPRRNRLYMAASQSLYCLAVEARGAHIT